MSESSQAQPEPKRRRATPVSEWSKALTRTIGSRVRWFRQQRRLDIQDLVAETDKLGHGLPRMTISSLENGKRESISVAEWLILARALDVPPVALLVREGAEEVEALPGVFVSTGSDLGWVTGAWPLQEGQEWTPAAQVPRLLMDHEYRLREYLSRRALAQLERERDGEGLAAALDRVEHGIRGLLAARRTLRWAGVENLPTLPPELEDMDRTTYAYVGGIRPPQGVQAVD